MNSTKPYIEISLNLIKSIAILISIHSPVIVSWNRYLNKMKAVTIAKKKKKKDDDDDEKLLR